MKYTENQTELRAVKLNRQGLASKRPCKLWWVSREELFIRLGEMPGLGLGHFYLCVPRGHPPVWMFFPPFSVTHETRSVGELRGFSLSVNSAATIYFNPSGTYSCLYFVFSNPTSIKFSWVPNSSSSMICLWHYVTYTKYKSHVEAQPVICSLVLQTNLKLYSVACYNFGCEPSL